MKLLSLLSYVAVVAGFICIAWTIPYVAAIISCYDTSVTLMDEINVRSRTQFWDERKICTAQYDAIGAIGACFESTKGKDSPFGFGKQASDYIIPLIRPKLKTINMLIGDHNVLCSAYQSLQFEQK